MGPEHKIVSVIFSYQENLSTCIGGTLTQSLFVTFQPSRIPFDMHWWGLNTKFFQRFAAIKNSYSHALMGPKHKIVSAICNDQEHSWICKGGTLTQNLFGDFQLSRILIYMHWWDLNTKSFRWFSAIKNTYSHALMGPKHSFFGDFQPSRIFIDMHWCDLNTKSFRWFSAIKKTYWHALVGPEHEIFSWVFSYQEHFFTCIDGT